MDFSPKTQQCVRFCPRNGLGSPHRESAPGRDARVEFYWCQAANVCRVPDEGEACAGLRRGYWSKLEKEAALRAEEQRPGAPEPGRPPTRSLVSPRTPPLGAPGSALSASTSLEVGCAFWPSSGLAEGLLDVCFMTGTFLLAAVPADTGRVGARLPVAPSTFGRGLPFWEKSQHEALLESPSLKLRRSQSQSEDGRTSRGLPCPSSVPNPRPFLLR